jgi:hypothetical protein
LDEIILRDYIRCRGPRVNRSAQDRSIRAPASFNVAKSKAFDCLRARTSRWAAILTAWPRHRAIDTCA